MTFGKPITELIRERFSCRTYSERPIEEEIRQKLAAFAAQATAGPLGSHPRFELVAASAEDSRALKGLGTYGFIKNPTGFLVGAIQPHGKDLEDFGYLMEEIILWATDLGLGTCWLGGSFTKSRFATKISLQPGESVPAVTSTGYITKKPRTLDPIIRQFAESDRRLPWSRLFFEGRFGNPLAREAAGAYATPLEMVRLGPSASNKQPWRIVQDHDAWHFYLQRTKGYRGGRIKKFMNMADMQRIDMGIAMSHFELAAIELGLEGEWVVDEPDLTLPGELTEYTVSWRS